MHYFRMPINKSNKSCATGDNALPRRDMSPNVLLIEGSLSGRVTSVA